MQVQRIETIRKRFAKHPEWLLIKVVKLDKATTTPLTGYILAHSPNRDEIYKKSISYKGLTLIDYSKDKFPKGYAAAF